jgi:hypothetical protein
MPLTSRRSFLTGLGALIASPAVIRTPGLLMPVRALVKPAGYFGLATVKREGELIAYDPCFDPTRIARMRAALLPGLRQWFSRAYADYDFADYAPIVEG